MKARLHLLGLGSPRKSRAESRGKAEKKRCCRGARKVPARAGRQEKVGDPIGPFHHRPEPRPASTRGMRAADACEIAPHAKRNQEGVCDRKADGGVDAEDAAQPARGGEDFVEAE